MKQIVFLFIISILTVATPVRAQDPLAVAPNMYKLLFENDKVRVMTVTFTPGAKIAKHSHPDHFVTVLEPGIVKIFKPDGSAQEIKVELDQVIWIPAETHWAENTGKSRVKLLVTELK